MNPTQRLEEVVTRLTPEQYARVVAFAEVLAQQTFEETAGGMRRRLARRWPAPLSRRFRALTAKLEAETLTEAERAELLALSEESERVSLARVEAVGELMRLYHVSHEEALAELNKGNNRRG